MSDGSVKAHQPCRTEIHRLLAVADRDFMLEFLANHGLFPGTVKPNKSIL